MIPIFDRLPRRRFPLVNYLLIAINVLVFAWERTQILEGFSERRLLLLWGLVPAHIARAPVDDAITVVTSMFMHDPADWHHIAGNMLFLWIFGDNVEDALGRPRYIAFYFLCGLFAAFAQVLTDPASRVPMVGASGAIAGVLAAYVSLFPRSPITVINPILPLWLFFGIFIELPAWVVIVEFFIINLLLGLTTVAGGASSVAFNAHIGGFVAGLILVRIFLPESPMRDHDRWQGFRPQRRQEPWPRTDPRQRDWWS
jgi:membrane associated rhomboid family serine protease